jgi:DNA-binding CsgD family transcriptional regulator
LAEAVAEAEEILTAIEAGSGAPLPACAPIVKTEIPLAAAVVGADLSRREREILRLLCQRLTDPEIAARLFLSPRTASNHVGSILSKLGVANRREAAALAARSGLV